MTEMQKLEKKMKILHGIANFVITPLVLLFIAVYFVTKPISVIDIILAVIVTILTLIDFLFVVIYSSKYKKLKAQEEAKK